MELSRVPNGLGRGGHSRRKGERLPGRAHESRSEERQVAHCRPCRSPNACFARGRVAASDRTETIDDQAECGPEADARHKTNRPAIARAGVVSE